MIGKRHFRLPMIILIILASLSIISVPVFSLDGDVTFDLTYYYLGGIVPGVAPGGFVTVDVYVDASALTPELGIHAWGINVTVDPTVLTPLAASASDAGYFLYDWSEATYGTQPFPPFNLVYPPQFLSVVGTDYIECSETFLPPPPTGANGTGKLCTLYFTSLSETAYSPLTIGPYPSSGYKDTNGTTYAINAINGHYNPPPKASLSGKVIDADSLLPIADATISYLSGPTVFNDTGTDADGNYTITDLDLGNYSVKASAVGYGDLTKNITLTEGLNTLNFELTSIAVEPGWIEGFVIDNATKAAIPGATVIADGAYTTTNAAGYYKIDKLPPKDYTVTVGAVGYPAQNKTDTVTSATGTTLNFTLTFVSPYIAIVPHGTMNPALAPGTNFTVSVYTDYNGTDVWGWELKLAYNPLVLQGVKVTNGDLINETTMWATAGFDNEVGRLGMTWNAFKWIDPPVPLTSGPGVLANVTFQVARRGYSDIILGPETKLKGFHYPSNGTGKYDIINSTTPNRIQHGFFTNVQPIHDVAVVGLEVPTTAVAGDIVNINVTVANEGIYLEVVNLTVTIHNDTNLIRSEFFLYNLESGSFRTDSVSWNTTDLTPGDYTTNATATSFVLDEDPGDNYRNQTTNIKWIHDVAITSLEAPDKLDIGAIVSLNTTVTNRGNYDENVTLTVFYEPIKPPIIRKYIDNQTFTLNKGESATPSSTWNTTDLKPGSYTINATAIIALDENPQDNSDTFVTVTLGHDVAVFSFKPDPAQVSIGELVTLNVTVWNRGSFNETFDVALYYGSVSIDAQTVESLPPGNMTSLTLSWNTTGVAAGVYTITAEAILEGDVDLTNNQRSDSVIVRSPLGMIAGNVADASTGLPIAGATVTAGNHTNTTDADGHYTISDIQPGNYTVTASATEYESSQRSITVVAGETTTMNFSLRVIITITILADPATIEVGESTTLDVSVSPSLEGLNITIQYKLSNEETWINLIVVITDENSQGTYAWTPETAGTYEVKAIWPGDEKIAPTQSSVQLVTVQESPAPGIPWHLYVPAAVVLAIVIIAIAVYYLRIRKRETA